MGTCLVTTLKEAVSDSNLLYIDEASIPYNRDSVGSFSMKIWSGKPVGTATIEGNCYFTDSTGTANYGKTATIPSTDSKVFYVSAGKCNIHIRNKYVVSIIRTDNFIVDSDTAYGLTANAQLDVPYTGDIGAVFVPGNEPKYILVLKGEEYKYGSIESAINSANSMITFIIWNGEGVTGNVTNTIAALNLITSVEIRKCPRLTGNISALQGKSMTRCYLIGLPLVKGDVSAFAGANIQELSLRGTGVSGNLSSFSTNTALTILNVSDTAITGDTSSLAGLSNLSVFFYDNTAITGTWPLT